MPISTSDVRVTMLPRRFVNDGNDLGALLFVQTVEF